MYDWLASYTLQVAFTSIDFNQSICVSMSTSSVVIRQISHLGGSLMSLLWYDIDSRSWRGVYPVEENGLLELRLLDPFDMQCCVAKLVGIGMSFECIKQLHGVMQVFPKSEWSSHRRHRVLVDSVTRYLKFITAHWASYGYHSDWLAKHEVEGVDPRRHSVGGRVQDVNALQVPRAPEELQGKRDTLPVLQKGVGDQNVSDPQGAPSFQACRNVG
jgi:hypothetical protein